MKNSEYIVHGTSSEKDAESIENEGFQATAGRATVSADLIYALDWATEAERRQASQSAAEVQPSEQGRIIVLKVPEGYRVDYASHTNIQIDADKKEITGYPKKFASGRRQLGIHASPGETQTKDKIEISKDNIILSIKPTEQLRTELEALRNSLQQMQAININEVADRVYSVVIAGEGEPVNLPINSREVIKKLVASTIEAEVINLVRNLALDVKRIKGFKVYNRPQRHLVEKDTNPEDLLDRLNDIKNSVEQDGFTTGIESVDRYIKKNTNRLIGELESYLKQDPN